MSVLRRTLGEGEAAIEVSAQGFGCMGMTANYGDPMADADAIELIDAVYKAGVTFWDTAEAYACEMPDGSTKYNETVLGDAIKALGLPRDELQLATKYMPTLHGDEMTPDMVVAACKLSCERLGVEQIDIYYAHRFHPEHSAAHQAKCYLACKEAGLAKCIGVSEFSPRNIREFHAICPITCIQNEWSLMNRDLEEDLVPACRELGIVDDLNPGDLRSERYPRFAAENLAANAKLVADVSKLAEERSITAAQLSLAWVASQGGDVVPIPGTTKVKNLLSNVEAQTVALTSDECAMVASAIDLDKVSGDRFTAAGQTFKANL